MQFTRLIKVNGLLKEFNFTKANRDNTGSFSVDTIDDRGNRIIFSMIKTEKGWELEPESFLPGWISAIEPQLNKQIEDEFQQIAG
jgi:hypothetical protein